MARRTNCLADNPHAASPFHTAQWLLSNTSEQITDLLNRFSRCDNPSPWPRPIARRCLQHPLPCSSILLIPAAYRRRNRQGDNCLAPPVIGNVLIGQFEAAVVTIIGYLVE